MLAAAPTTNGGGGSGFLVLAIVAIVVVVLIRRLASRRSGVAQQTQSQAVIGSEVMTGSGLYGTVVGQDDEQVLLEIAPGVQVRFARAAIARVINAGDASELDDHFQEPHDNPFEGPHEGPPEPPDDAIDPPGDTTR